MSVIKYRNYYAKHKNIEKTNPKLIPAIKDSKKKPEDWLELSVQMQKQDKNKQTN